MRVLVTGTDGYIGVLLAPYLAERGHDVVGLDTGYYRDGWLYPGPEPARPTLNKDLREVTERDLRGFDAIAHLAELSNDPLGQHRPEITYEINHQGTVELARKCKASGVARFVYTSSCSVYGIADGELLKTEQSPTNPQTAYARCKVLVERDVGALADESFSPTFLRNATAYGPSPRMRFDIVLNNLAGLAWTTREIKMTSDGTPWRPLVHVLDICQAVACALEAPREAVHDQIYNVGSSQENYQVRELAGIIADCLPGCRVTFGSSDGDNRSYRVEFSKIRQGLPGFTCARNARQGAAELFELFERIQLSRETFEFRAYTRLQQLKHLLQTHQIDDRFYWIAS
jgi:nucleoside-diphosphate-sugar epimerase